MTTFPPLFLISHSLGLFPSKNWESLPAVTKEERENSWDSEPLPTDNQERAFGRRPFVPGSFCSLVAEVTTPTSLRIRSCYPVAQQPTPPPQPPRLLDSPASAGSPWRGWRRAHALLSPVPFLWDTAPRRAGVGGACGSRQLGCSRRACVREAVARGSGAGRLLRPRRRTWRRRPQLPPVPRASPAKPPPTPRRAVVAAAGGVEEGGSVSAAASWSPAPICRRHLPPRRSSLYGPIGARSVAGAAPRRAGASVNRGSGRGLAARADWQADSGERGAARSPRIRTPSSAAWAARGAAGGRAAPGPGRPRSSAPAPPPAPGRSPAEEGAAVSGPRAPFERPQHRGLAGPEGRRRVGGRALSSLAPPPPFSKPSTLRPLSPPDHGRRRRAVRGCVRAVRGDRQVSLHARERECGKMHFSDARVLPHPHPPRACPGPAPCPPSPPPPWNSFRVWVWGVPSDPWTRTSRGRPPHEAWGRPKSAFCILSDGCTGTWPNWFYSCFLGTVGFIVTFRLPHTINEKSSLHFFCLRGEKEKERPGILIAGCVSIVQDIR